MVLLSAVSRLSTVVSQLSIFESKNPQNPKPKNPNKKKIDKRHTRHRDTKMYQIFRERRRMPNHRFHEAHVSLRSMHVWRFVSPRLILRNLPFNQSRAQVNVHNDYGPRTQPSTSKAIYKLYRHDWFHNFLRWPTLLSVVFLLILWTCLTLFFSILYLVHDKLKTSQTCSLWPPITGDDGTLVPTPPLHIYTSFTFALETGTTVGYALPGKSIIYRRSCLE